MANFSSEVPIRVPAFACTSAPLLHRSSFVIPHLHPTSCSKRPRPYLTLSFPSSPKPAFPDSRVPNRPPIMTIDAQHVREEELSLRSPDGTMVGAFLALSNQTATDSSDTRAVILMTDVLGYTNENTRAVARRLAAAGLITIVPDLFREKPWAVGRDMSGYESWRIQHEPATVRGDLLLARDELTRRRLGASLGLIGFCFGGGRLMDEVARNTAGLNPKAAAAFYPTRFDAQVVGRNVRCPLLVQTGDQDHLVPMTDVETLRRTLEKNDLLKEWKVDVFEGRGHAFAHHPITEEDKVQSEIALNNAVTWLQRHL